jgi:hypothetical protein
MNYELKKAEQKLFYNTDLLLLASAVLTRL